MGFFSNRFLASPIKKKRAYFAPETVAENERSFSVAEREASVVEAPVTRAIKILRQISNGETVSQETMEELSADLLTSKDINRPNLRRQLQDSDYNPDISAFLMQSTRGTLELESLKSLRERKYSLTPGTPSTPKTPRSSPSTPSGLTRKSRGDGYCSTEIFECVAKERKIRRKFSTNPTLPDPSLDVTDEENDEEGADADETFPDEDHTSYFNSIKLGEDLHFDVLQLKCSKHPLVDCAMHLLKRLDLIQKLQLVEKPLVLFLRKVESGYASVNPYHNAFHAADVTQRLFTILCTSKAYPVLLSNTEMLAALLAAVIHDYGHPGKNNMYLVNTNHTAAQTHNDQHVLENHSLHVCLKVLAKMNFMENISVDSRKEIRKTIISMVLATDMANHFEVVEAFNQKISLSDIERRQLESNQRLALLEMALKVADIGHTSLRAQEHLHWVRALQHFFKQGDCERSMKMTISPLCDRERRRNGPASGENQIGFFDFICKPLCTTFVNIFPDCSSLVDQLEINYKLWEEDSKMASVTDDNDCFQSKVFNTSLATISD